MIILVSRTLKKSTESNNIIYQEKKEEIKPLTFKVETNSEIKNDTSNTNFIENSNSELTEKRTVRKEINFLSDYTVIDTETTGLSDNDKIVEIAAARVRNNEVVQIFEHIINPEIHISSQASKINKITDEMVKAAPTFKMIENEFLNFIADDVLIGHNISFDLKFIKRELSHQLKNDFQDTLLIAQKSNLQIENYKLETLAKYFKIQDNQKHRADDDVLITGKLYEELKRINSGKKLYTTYTETISDITKIFNGNVKNVTAEQFWNDVENNKKPPYFTNWDRIDIVENPVYDRIEIKNLLTTSAKDNSSTASKRVNKQYNFIKNEIIKYGGKFFGKGAKSAKSYIEFFYMDYGEYKEYKKNDLKLYHASDVEDFLVNHKNEINDFINNLKYQEEKLKKDEDEIRAKKKAIALENKQKRLESKEKNELLRAERQKEIENLKEKNATIKNKILVQMDDDGNVIKKFKTLAEASRTLKINSKSIRECCNGIQKHAGGFVWRYEENL